MDFGNIEYTYLSEEHFAFPAVDLSKFPGTPAPSPKIYIGFPKMDEPAYKGRLYSEKVKIDQRLGYYSAKFNTLEFNATHYKYYSSIHYDRWGQPGAKQ